MASRLPGMSGAVLLIAVAVPAWAQTPPMPRDPGAAANVRQSQQYEQELRSNPSFRAQRMRLECGPISDPQLHQQCVDSFGGGAPSSARGQR
jgi:hypothetical protein